MYFGGGDPMGPHQAKPAISYAALVDRLTAMAAGIDGVPGISNDEKTLLHRSLVGEDRESLGVFTDEETQAVAQRIDGYVAGVSQLIGRCELSERAKRQVIVGLKDDAAERIRTRHARVHEYFSSQAKALGGHKIEIQFNEGVPEVQFVGRRRTGMWLGPDFDPTREYKDAFVLTTSALGKELYRRIPYVGGPWADRPADISGDDFAAAIEVDAQGKLQLLVYQIFPAGRPVFTTGTNYWLPAGHGHHMYMGTAWIPDDVVQAFLKEKLPPPALPADERKTILPGWLKGFARAFATYGMP